MAKLTAKELNATSMELAKSANDLGKQIHSHCINLMLHIEAHRDVSVADFFVGKLAKTDKAGKENHSIIRAEAVKRWLKDFAFVSFGDKGAKLNKSAYDKAKGTDEFKGWNMTARANAWNRYTPEPGAMTAPFDIDAVIDGLIKGLEERREKAIKHEGQYARQTEEARKQNVIDSDRFRTLLALKRDKEQKAA